MEIRVLRYFLTVAQEGSMTAAAELLHVTQPTLSRQLKNLEEELGEKLFIRSNYNLKLTDEGCLFRQRAKSILEMVDKTTAEFKTMEKTISGNVYLGAAQTNAVQSIAKVAKKLQNAHSNISYHLYDNNFDDITEKLDRGTLDFGIVVQPVNVAKYNFLALPDKSKWGVIMKKNSPLAQKDNIKVHDLINLPLICSRQAIKQSPSGNEFIEWFGEAFQQLTITATFNLVYNASLMVKEDLGYLIAFDDLINTSSESTLCFRPLEPILESQVYLIWKKDQLLSKAAEAFLKQVKNEFY